MTKSITNGRQRKQTTRLRKRKLALRIKPSKRKISERRLRTRPRFPIDGIIIHSFIHSFYLNIYKKNYQFKTQCKDDVMISVNLFGNPRCAYYFILVNIIHLFAVSVSREQDTFTATTEQF